MLINFCIAAAGIAVLVLGGELLVKGAASLARGLGVTPLAVGLTVVAFGTSAPELAVSVNAALHDSSDLAFGNIFGSNMANIGLILSLSAILRPLPIDYIVVRRELPMMLLSVAAAIIMAADTFLGDGPDTFSRSDGLVLLLFFVVFIYYTAGDLLRKRSQGEEIGTEEFEGIVGGKGELRPFRDLMLSIAGLAGLLIGAHLTITGGVGIAEALGVPQVIIGLTLVSVGTSLPELVACLAAVRRGEVEIAVGGIVGSNIFNTLLVCGATATLRPIPLPAIGGLDLAATAILSLMLLFTARTHDRRIIRAEGGSLLVIYLIYMTWRTLYLQS